VSGAPANIEAVQCFDGLGRAIQTRQKAGPERYLASGYVQFNIQGKEARIYQPYEGSASACDTQEPEGVLYAETFFDGTGRPIEVITPDESIYGSASIAETRYGPLWTESWDAEDNDPNSSHQGTPSRVSVDGLGRTVAMEAWLEADGEPAVTRISYDSLGRLQNYVDAAGNRKTHFYDLLGRMVKIEDPNAGTLRFAHDAAGNLTRSTDARGEVVRQAYDEANRVAAKWHEADAIASRVYYFYDESTELLGCPACTHPEGQLVGVSYPIGDGTRGHDLMGYDERGRTTYSARVLGGAAFEFESHFDNADRLVGTTYPDGQRIDSVLDPAGRVTQVPGFVDLVTYTNQGNLDSILLANGTRTEYGYDVLQRQDSILTRGLSGEELQDLQYTRDRVSNLVGIFDDRPADGLPRATAELTYDAWYRLGTAAFEDETLSFSYDRINNILSKRSSLGFASKAHVGAYRYGEDGAGPYAVTTTEIGFYLYDAAGNMTLHGREAYEWDYLGRLRQVHLGPKQLAWFGYGPDRERVVKKEGVRRTYYVAPDFEIRDGIAITYVRIGGNRVVKIESDALAAQLLPDAVPQDGLITASDAYQAIVSGASKEEVDLLLAASVRRTVRRGVTYLHHNHQGTTVATTDAHGELLQRTEHYPYGEVRHQSGFLEDYSYTGQERDRATGLSYHSARYYDPRLGRWPSVDPLFLRDPEKGIESPLETNLYSYVANNPVACVDFSGLELVKITLDDKTGHLLGKSTIVIEKKMASDMKSLLQHAVDNKIKVHINSSFRTSAQQGGSIQETGMTPAAMGTSPHEGGLALDFNLYDESGNIISGNSTVTSDNSFIKKAKDLGFRWGGDWTTKDPIHIDAGASSKEVYGYENRAAAIAENQKYHAEHKDSLPAKVWTFETSAGAAEASSADGEE
jgi:RHS repeat-associated protein